MENEKLIEAINNLANKVDGLEQEIWKMNHALESFWIPVTHDGILSKSGKGTG